MLKFAQIKVFCTKNRQIFHIYDNDNLFILGK